LLYFYTNQNFKNILLYDPKNSLLISPIIHSFIIVRIVQNGRLKSKVLPHICSIKTNKIGDQVTYNTEKKEVKKPKVFTGKPTPSCS
jgi:hypothetical protein